MPPGSDVRTWTNCPARAPDTAAGACHAWSHVPGRISRRSTSSAPARRTAARPARRGPMQALGAPPVAAVDVAGRLLVLEVALDVLDVLVALLAFVGFVALELGGDRREGLGERVG